MSLMTLEARVARYQRIIRLYAGGKGMTLKEIGVAEGITRERVRQIIDGGVPAKNGRPAKKPAKGMK